MVLMFLQWPRSVLNPAAFSGSSPNQFYVGLRPPTLPTTVHFGYVTILVLKSKVAR